jgi:hypothetical protein
MDEGDKELELILKERWEEKHTYVTTPKAAEMLNIPEWAARALCSMRKKTKFPAEKWRVYQIDTVKLMKWKESKIGNFHIAYYQALEFVTQTQRDGYIVDVKKRRIHQELHQAESIEEINEIIDSVKNLCKDDGKRVSKLKKLDFLSDLYRIRDQVLDVTEDKATFDNLDRKRATKILRQLNKMIEGIESDSLL